MPKLTEPKPGQTSLFGENEIKEIIQDGKKLTKKGIKRAVDHANRKDPNWEIDAVNFVQTWFTENNIKYFIIQDARKASQGIVPEPPDTRAWGRISTSLRSKGLIQFHKVTNRTDGVAHGAYVNQWEVI